jgi:hypothetical protein
MFLSSTNIISFSEIDRVRIISLVQRNLAPNKIDKTQEQTLCS